MAPKTTGFKTTLLLNLSKITETKTWYGKAFL